MSTRCQIGFYKSKGQKHQDFEALLYRHSDGYPGTPDGKEYGVLADIVPFLKWFSGARGISDLDYCAARLLQWLCNKYDKDTGQYEVGIGSKDSPFTGTLGHGICKDFHWDIEYFYKIYPDAVEVWQTVFGGENGPVFDKWTKLDTIELKG